MTRQTSRILFVTFCLASLAVVYLGIEVILAKNESAPANLAPTTTAERVVTRRVGESLPAELEPAAELAEPPAPRDVAELIQQMRLARHGKPYPLGHYAFFDPLRQLDAAQLREALEIVRRTVKEDPLRYEFDLVLLSEWAKKDGPAAMAYAIEHRDIPPQTILAAWSREDPDGPWQWYLAERKKGAVTFETLTMLGVVFGGMVVNDPAKGFARLQTLQDPELTSAIEWIALFLRIDGLNRTVGLVGPGDIESADRVRVLTHAESLPAKLRQPVRESIVSVWASDDPLAAAAWVRSRPQEEIDRFRTAVEKGLIAGGFRAVELLLEMTPQSDKPRAYAAIAEGWFPTDLPDAMDWAKSIPEKDQRAIAVQTIHIRLTSELGAAAADAILAAPARTAEQCARDKLPPPLPSEDNSAIPPGSIPGL